MSKYKAVSNVLDLSYIVYVDCTGKLAEEFVADLNGIGTAVSAYLDEDFTVSLECDSITVAAVINLVNSSKFVVGMSLVRAYHNLDTETTVAKHMELNIAY